MSSSALAEMRGDTTAALPTADHGMAARGSSILLVEDDCHIRRSVSFQLNRRGYEVTACEDGETGLTAALRRPYSVLVLDVMLPKLDGLSLCKQVRAARPGQPIILVSARGSDLDKICGLEFGADDYLSKPFNAAELEARIRALQRRATPSAPGEETGELRVGELVLDRDRFELRFGENIAHLTRKELALLTLLMGSPGRVFSRENLVARVWGFTYQGYHRAVDAHVTRLRAKLIEHLGDEGQRLEGVYGAGYRFRASME